MYTDLEDKLSKEYYIEILNNALARAKEDYENFPKVPIHISFYNQLIDIKKTVVDESKIYTRDEAYDKYPMAVTVNRNFLGKEGNTDYAKMIKDIVWGISLYPTMPEK